MNTVEGAFFTYASAQSTINTYWGGSSATARLYPLKLKQGATLPAFSYAIVAGSSGPDIGGTSIRRSYKRIQVSAWSPDIREAKAMIEALRVLVTGFVGYWDDVAVSVVGFEHGPDIYDHIAKVHHISCHLLVWHGIP